MSGWYTIRAAAPDEAEVWIHGEIGWEITSGTFIDEMKALGDAVKRLRVRINSPGGYVFDGVAIYNMLREHPAAIEVMVDGLAASAASVIAMAGDRIVMGPASVMMVHRASGLTLGTAEDMRKMAGALDVVDEAITEAYARKSKRPKAEMTALMTAETWMTAEQAVENGLADAISGDDEEDEGAAAFAPPIDAAQALRLVRSLYNHAPPWVEHRIAAMGKGRPMAAGTNQPTSPQPEPGHDAEAEREDGKMTKEMPAPAGAETKPEAAAPSGPTADELLAADRRRVAALKAMGARHPGHDAIVDAAIADGRSPEAAALEILNAPAPTNAGHLATLRQDLPGEAERPKAPGASAEIDEASLAALPLEEACKRRWATSPALRAEYGEDGLQRFVAYEKANAAGQVRMLSKPRAA